MPEVTWLERMEPESRGHNGRLLHPGAGPLYARCLSDPRANVLTLFQMVPSLFKGKRKEPGK